MKQATFIEQLRAVVVRDVRAAYRVYRLTQPAVDVTGRVWPAGTEYIPHCISRADVLQVQKVHIRGPRRSSVEHVAESRAVADVAKR